jgi:hypothetical protein
MRMILIFTLIILSGFIDCDTVYANSYKRITLTDKAAEEALTKQEFKCAGINGKLCPEGIVKVIIANGDNPENSGLCSGFLVSPTVMVTNHHCISTKKHCDGTRLVVYNGHGYENARCKRIIKAHVDSRSENRRKVDFSVIELNHDIRSARQFDLSDGLVTIGENLSAWVIDHISITQSRITELPCVLKGTDAGLELSNCASISGNSGSPVINQHEKIVGTLWAGTTDDDVNEQTPLRQRRSTDALSYVTELKEFRIYVEQ